MVERTQYLKDLQLENVKVTIEQKSKPVQEIPLKMTQPIMEQEEQTIVYTSEIRQLADYKDYDIDCEPNTAILIAVGSAGDAVPYNNFALHLDRLNIVPIIITQPDLAKYFDQRFNIFTT